MSIPTSTWTRNNWKKWLADDIRIHTAGRRLIHWRPFLCHQFLFAQSARVWIPDSRIR
jgi:hypothetical protein